MMPNALEPRIVVSPLAKRLAAQMGVELTGLSGTGPRGRIIKRDIEGASAGGAKSIVLQQVAASNGKTGNAVSAVQAMSDEQVMALYDPGSYEIVPHTSMRRTIATRLVQAKLTIPHFYLSVDCELDALLQARARMNAQAPQDGPSSYKLSVNDFIIKALGMALQQVPDANATWTEQGILRHSSSDVGVAVSVEGGLFTPVVRHVELKSLSEISNEVKDLAARARERRLAPHEYQGGTTSISNLGMYGIKKFDAIINPPHASILAVGKGEKQAVVRGDSVEAVSMMSVSLSCDHRVVDGALGAELLEAFKRFIQDPVTMLV